AARRFSEASARGQARCVQVGGRDVFRLRALRRVLEGGALRRGVPLSAEALGAVRAGAFGFVLCEVLLTSFNDLGRLPVTVLRPTGAMRLLPWGFYERLLTPASMAVYKWLFVVALLAATAGALTSVSTKTAALLFLFYQGLLRSFT